MAVYVSMNSIDIVLHENIEFDQDISTKVLVLGEYVTRLNLALRSKIDKDMFQNHYPLLIRSKIHKDMF